MKILKPYASQEQLETIAYNGNSPLGRAIREQYDYTEVVFDETRSEEEKAAVIREYDVLMTMWGSPHVPNCLASDPGNLRYICNITGEMTKWIDYDIIESPHLTVTNWGDAPAYDVAEGSFALLMAVQKDIPVFR